MLWLVALDVLDPDGCGDFTQIDRIIIGPPFHFIWLGLGQVLPVLTLLRVTHLPTYLPLHLIYLKENV